MSLSAFASSSELVAALEDPPLAWLIGIGLLDQLPVMGRVNSRPTSKGKGRYSAGSASESKTAGIRLSYELIPVSIVFQPESELWSVTGIKEAEGNTQGDSSAHIWLANVEGRWANQQNIVA